VDGFPFDVGDVVVFLAAAGLLAPLLHRFRLSPVLTFLLAGVAVGPFGLGRLAETFPWVEAVAITNVEPAEALAEVGVVLLLFLIGLEVSAKRLWAMRRLVVGLGGAQVVVTTAALALAAGLLGATPAAAFVIGAALALSSTAIVLELLTVRRQLGAPTGQATLSTLLTQDIAVVPVLILVAILASGDAPGKVSIALAQAAGAAALAIAGIVLAGRVLARPFLRRVASRRSPEMFVAAVLLLIVLTGAATNVAGLSVALGAFLAGLLLAETEYRHEIDAMLAPFKGLLLGLFFLSIGMRLDLARVIAEPLVLLAGLAILLVVKTLITLAAARVLRLGWPAAIESALLLAPGGEFAFVVLATAGRQGVVPADAVAYASLLAGASMMLTPLIAGPARRLALAVERRTQAAQPPSAGLPDLREHTVIVGYGRVGRLLGELLCEAGSPMVALDRDAELVAARRKKGEAVFFGDALHTDILNRLAIERAAALVVTMDEPDAVEAVVRAARRGWPELAIYARARDSAHAARLAALGAERVTPETLEASLELAEAVLAGVGMGEEAARAVVEARRRSELETIAARGRAKEKSA
jgi:CPA2 family monovalent cation:H+ antiporter-2